MPEPAVSPAVIVHGGAGTFSGGAGQSDEARLEAARRGCHRAVEVALARLEAGASAVEAAQAAVRILEDEPVFNAGIGSVLNRDGKLEMDAAIMDGGSLRIGAVAALPNAGRAIDVARAVLEDGEHILLAGEAAWEFAREHGIEPDDAEQLITAFSRERWQREAPAAGGAPGTVGACAVDARGNTAAATSTGGTSRKRPGRVGDTPLPGCGTYADDLGGAASATGDGESIVRVTLSRQCIDRLRSGVGPSKAAWEAVGDLSDRVGGDAGIICMTPDGRPGAAHNTAHMPWGIGVVNGAPRLAVGVTLAEGEDIWEELPPL